MTEPLRGISREQQQEPEGLTLEAFDQLVEEANLVCLKSLIEADGCKKGEKPDKGIIKDLKDIKKRCFI